MSEHIGSVRDRKETSMIQCFQVQVLIDVNAVHKQRNRIYRSVGFRSKNNRKENRAALCHFFFFHIFWHNITLKPPTHSYSIQPLLRRFLIPQDSQGW